MSNYQARAAFDQLVGRPALISQAHIGRTAGPGSEVTSGVFADLRELSTAPSVEPPELTQERNRLLLSAYGFDVVSNDKPFAFANGYAMIPIHGTLINRFNYSWGYVTGYNFIRTQLAQALADPDVTTIIFDINSHGGMVSGCQETADMIFAGNAANGGKPIICVIDSNCHSGAYFTGAQGDYVSMTPSGSVGSIGVMMTHFDVSKMMENWGVDVTYLISGAHKVDGNPYEPLSDEVRADFQACIDAVYETFIAAVARGRGLDPEVVRDTEARCYDAPMALELGLIDAIQNPSSAVEAYLASCIDDEGESDDNGGEDGDTPHEPDNNSVTQETIMAVKPAVTAAAPTTTAAAAPAVASTTAVTEVASVDAAQVASTARGTERQRIASIQNHAEAAGRTALASHLALNTDMDVETAAGILAAAPKETVTAAPAATETNHFSAAMAAGGHPNTGASSPASESSAAADGGLSPAKRILRLQASQTGFVPKVVA